MRVMPVVPESLTLTPDAFDEMCIGAKVLERDDHGLKVLQLADGNMLKLFRVKRRWSSATLFPYSRRFCRNASRLLALGVPTVSVCAFYKLSRPGWTAVLYQPLPGLTLRQIARERGLSRQVLQQLGLFIAELHQRGIYFRSSHLGNIVVTPAGTLGLIDIADLDISHGPLGRSRRMRNFKHICRVPEDRNHLGLEGWGHFVEAYMQAANASAPGISSFDVMDVFRKHSQ